MKSSGFSLGLARQSVGKYMVAKLFIFFKKMRFLWLICCLGGGFALARDSEILLPVAKELQGGWYNLDPYLYQKEENGIKSLHGLDFELMRFISKDIGEKIEYQYVSWNNLLKEIKAGSKDFATGAIFSKERARYAYYSIPYRYEEDSLFIHKNKFKDIKFENVKDFIAYMKKNKFRLGIVKGYIYADPLLNQYLQDPNYQNLIVKSNNDYENVDDLLNNQIDGFIADRIVASTVIWRMQANKNVMEHRLHIRSPIHIIFSKKTVPFKLVQKYNDAINRINDIKGYRKIVCWYLYPILFLQSENLAWFKFTEIIGTIAFAISGLMIAFKEKTTLFGALILAILPSLGGGLMRDVIVARNPVGALQSPVYLLCVILTVLIGFVTIKILEYLRQRYKFSKEIENLIWRKANQVLIVTDAIGLAMFSVTGVIVSLSAKVDPLWLWGPSFAFLTGAGGGILRDMLSKSRYIAALEGELYGEIAIIWGFLLSVFIIISANNAQPEYIQYGVIFTSLGIFFTRLIVHFMRIPNARFRHQT